jgi:hypothetical protein
MTTPPINKVVRGIRARISGGYLLGRTSGGDGPVELITMKQAQAGGILPSTLPPSGPAGGDLGGTYPNPTVAKLQTNPVKNAVLGAGDDGKVLTWVNANGDWEAMVAGGGGGVAIGIGPPSSLQPAGTLYSQSDTAAVWSSQPTAVGGNPSVAQFASANNHSLAGSPTLPSAPTVGNLIVLFLGSGSNSFANVDTTKWTVLTHGGATHFGLCAYRYVQVGDTAALPSICSSGFDYWASEAYEIANVSGVWANDFDQFKDAYDLTASPITTTSMSTVLNNELAILGTMQYNAVATMSVAAPWTTDITGLSAANFGSFDLASRAITTSGTAVTATITLSGSDKAFYVNILFKPSTLAVHWVLVGPDASILTKAEKFSLVVGSIRI